MTFLYFILYFIIHAVNIVVQFPYGIFQPLTSMSEGEEVSCGAAAVMVFILALIAGTFCSLSSKVLLSMKGIGMTGEVEDFSFPLFQTFGNLYNTRHIVAIYLIDSSAGVLVHPDTCIHNTSCGFSSVPLF